MQPSKPPSTMSKIGATDYFIEKFFLYDDIVTVSVGPESRAFQIYKPLLCKCSAFFEAAFSDGFVETSTSSVSLGTQDPEVFKAFVCWLYSGSFLSPSRHIRGLEANDEKWEKSLQMEVQYIGEELPKASEPYETEIDRLRQYKWYLHARFDKLVDLYILSDYLQVDAIRDLILKMMVNVYADQSHPDKHRESRVYFWRWSRLPPGERPSKLPYPGPAITKAWSHLPESDPLCKTLVLLYCDNCFSAEETFQQEGEAENLPRRFLEICFRQVQRRLREGRVRSFWGPDEHISQLYTKGMAFSPS